MAVFKYPRALAEFQRGNLDIDSGGDQVLILLVDDSYVPSAAHEFISDVVANELSAVNYSRKNVVAQSVAVVGNNAVLDGNNIEWDPGIQSQEAGGHIVAVNKGTDATSLVLAFDDRPSLYPVTFNGTIFRINWDANGIYRFLGG